MRFKLELSYDGTAFGGWQKQPSGTPTVQGSLEKMLTQILNEPIRVQGSGRTDAGVHAVRQIAHFDCERSLDGPKFLRSLNALANDGLVVRSVWSAPDEFHARKSATQKTYHYRVWNSKTPPVFQRRYSLWVPKPLSLLRLNDLSQPLNGEHDFKSFQTQGTPVNSTVRTIFEAKWLQLSPQTLEFRISGSGFLKQMVRNIVGTLLHSERNGLDPTEITQILQARDRGKAKATAPPHGLFLFRVKYPQSLDNKCRKI